MRFLKVLPILVLWPGVAVSASVQAQADASQPRFAQASLRAPSAGLRHCGGACLKSGSLSWSCPVSLECALSCATAPPVMRCLSR